MKNPFVFAKPPFAFRTTMDTVRLTEIEYFLVHSVKLPGRVEAECNILVCASWPIVHPKQHYFGKPVEVWSNNLYEPSSINRFFLASSIQAQAIIATDEVCGERVLVAISIIEE